MDNILAKMIFDSFKKDDSGIIGKAMFDAVTRKDEDSSGDVQPLSEWEIENIEKLKEFKKDEDNGNLVHMGYGDWNNLPKAFQDYFQANIKSVFSNCIVFAWSQFEEMEAKLLPHMGSAGYLGVLSSNKNNRQMVWVDANSGTRFDCLSDNQIREYQRDYESRLLTKYGVAQDGQVVKIIIKERP